MAKSSRFENVGARPLEVTGVPVVEEAQPVATPALEAGMVQLNITVPPELRKAVRQKALEQGIPLTVALRQVLQDWVES